MSIATNILQFLKKKASGEDVQTPEGLCPNCWGRQEYGGQFFEKLKNHTTDINKDEPEIGWITDYAEKHLKGIKLNHIDGALVCATCKYSFRPVDS